MLEFSAHTDGFTVTAKASFSETRSMPEDHLYFWHYHIEIESLRSDPFQLLKRYWKITSAQGDVKEVHGDGVVGQTPVLQSGEIFAYDSGVPLNTPSGIMLGHFELIDLTTCAPLIINIPAFSLDSKHDDGRPN